MELMFCRSIDAQLSLAPSEAEVFENDALQEDFEDEKVLKIIASSSKKKCNGHDGANNNCNEFVEDYESDAVSVNESNIQ